MWDKKICVICGLTYIYLGNKSMQFSEVLKRFHDQGISYRFNNDIYVLSFLYSDSEEVTEDTIVGIFAEYGWEVETFTHPSLNQLLEKIDEAVAANNEDKFILLSSYFNDLRELIDG